MIIGCGGSGKSTLAIRLGGKLSLPVHHIDRMYWRPGWTESTIAEMRKLQEGLCAQPRWVIDGNYASTMDIRLAACDTVVYLDLSTFACFAGAVRRYLQYRGRTRPDMTDGCPERLSWDYLVWIWNFRRKIRPDLLKRLQDLKDGKQVVILTSRKAVRHFLDGNPGESAKQPMQSTQVGDAAGGHG